MLRVSHVQGFKYLVQPILFLRDSDQMHVVGHKAVRKYFQCMLFTIVIQQLKIGVVIRGIKKHLRTVISPLGNVMRGMSKNCSW